jgi:hypothetical protein
MKFLSRAYGVNVAMIGIITPFIAHDPLVEARAPHETASSYAYSRQRLRIMDLAVDEVVHVRL